MKMKRVWGTAKALLGRVSGSAAGRGLTVYGDDVFLVSYPRSGNTWMRFLLYALLHGDALSSFANVDHAIPGIYRHADRTLRRLPKPRILKSHEYFDPRYKRVIYLVRDPRDVLLSYYRYHLKLRRIDEGYPPEEYASLFVAGDLDGFGSWAQNAGSWLGARQGSEGFLLLRYEDLLEQPEHELRKVASFLGIKVTRERLVQSVSSSTADRMRTLEKEGSWGAMKNTRNDKAFVGPAREGAWRTELPAAAVARVEAAWDNLMRELGYPVSRNSGANG